MMVPGNAEKQLVEIGNDDAVADELLADGFAVGVDENSRFFCTLLEHPVGSMFQGCGFLLVGAGKGAASLVECPVVPLRTNTISV